MLPIGNIHQTAPKTFEEFLKDSVFSLRIKYRNENSKPMKPNGKKIGRTAATLNSNAESTSPELVIYEEHSLSEEESHELERCESVINQHLAAFFEVGKALIEIQRKKLYRTQYQTFEEYCHKRWDMSRFYAYRHIQGAEVVGHLLTIGNIPLPQNEAQVRPLVSLPLKQATKTWMKVLAESEGKTITGKMVEKAARQTVKIKQRASRREKETWQLAVDPLLLQAGEFLRKGKKSEFAGVWEHIGLLLQVGEHGKKQPEENL